MPIIDVVGIGPVELPDGMSDDQMKAALMKLPKPAFKPSAQNAGNVINSDVPTVVGERPNAVNAQPPAQPSSLWDKMKAVAEVPTAIVTPMVTEPASMAYGVGRSVIDAVKNGGPLDASANKYYRQAADALRYTPTSPVSQEILGTIGEAFDAAKIPAYTPVGGKLPSLAAASRPAALQVAGALRDEGKLIKDTVAPMANRAVAAATPVVEQAVDMAKPLASRAAAALRSEPKIDIAKIAKTAPEPEVLAAKSSQLFQQAKESGVELNPEYFSNMMKSVGKDLRGEGYDARLMPKVAVALDEMQNSGIPKDFQELTTLRKFIQNAQKSVDPDERRVASILKSDFDDYVANISDSSVIGGDKTGLKLWKDARDTYSRMSKSEIFLDMLEDAELDKTKFSMSGAENSLSNQLRLLAKNDKKMRLFTPDEQAAIIQASKGTFTQNTLRVLGKFMPNSAVSSIPALLATSISGPVGLALTAGSIGARYGATKMRKNDVKNLAAMMRATKSNQAKGLQNE